jgi:hypothetical protein
LDFIGALPANSFHSFSWVGVVGFGLRSKSPKPP